MIIPCIAVNIASFFFVQSILSPSEPLTFDFPILTWLSKGCSSHAQNAFYCLKTDCMFIQCG